MVRKILVSMMAITSLFAGTSCSAASGNSKNITEEKPDVEQKEIGRASCRERVSSPV